MARKQNPHRGRFQAQGDGTEESVNWTREAPITMNDGSQSLNWLKLKLTPAGAGYTLFHHLMARKRPHCNLQFYSRKHNSTLWS